MNYKNNPYFKNYPSYYGVDAQPNIDLDFDGSNVDAQPMLDLNVNGSQIDVNGSDYSNASGCTPAICSNTKIIKGSRTEIKRIPYPCPTLKQPFKVCYKEQRINIPTIKTVTNQDCIDKKKKYKDCISAKLKEAGKKLKKVVKSIKEKVGKAGKNFRNRFRQVLRKGILFKIKNNTHGTATRMYPAIGNPADIKSRKYKLSFVNKSKNSYDKILREWIKFGGTKEDLDKAIIEGSKKRFLKNPYKSFAGNHSNSFYDAYIYNYYGADGEVDGEIDEVTGEEEVPSEEETKKGLMAFIARIIAFFKGSGADENPYEEGSSESTDYNTDVAGDMGNEPTDTNGDGVLNELDNNTGADDVGGETDRTKGEDGEEDDEADSDTIMGIPKTGFYVGLGVLVILGGYFGYRKFIAKK